MDQPAEQPGPTEYAGPTEQAAPPSTQTPWTEEEFAALMRELATGDAPRLFAIVEEYGEAEDARVAGYGLAYEDRAEVDSVEGGFHLNSQSPETARTLFEISSRSAGVRQAHLVWLDEPMTSAARTDRGRP